MPRVSTREGNVAKCTLTFCLRNGAAVKPYRIQTKMRLSEELLDLLRLWGEVRARVA